MDGAARDREDKSGRSDLDVDMNESESRVHAEFEGLSLEKRLRERVARTIAAAVAAPDKTFPKMLGDDAATDGCYRLLSNERVDSEVLAGPHRTRTATRVAEVSGDCIVAHDTSAIAYDGDGKREGLGPLGSPRARGFFLHASLAIERSTVRPLGALATSTWARSDEPKSSGGKHRHGNETILDPTRESLRWQHSIASCAERTGQAASRLLHVMDSEGDSYSLFAWLHVKRHRYVVRLAHDRCIVDDDSHRIRELLASQPIRFTREVAVSARKAQRVSAYKKRKKSRSARVAHLSVCAVRVRLRAPAYLRATLGNEMSVNVVRVIEREPPEGDEPVDWILYTTEPIESDADIASVIDAYRTRWQIEDFFKALKTGCQIEKRQLESYRALTNALALFIPIAWQMLLLRNVARTDSGAPATDVLTETQIAVINALNRKKLEPRATARDALLLVAGIGGHFTHNGEPGWQTIAAGFERITQWEAGWAAKDVRNE